MKNLTIEQRSKLYSKLNPSEKGDKAKMLLAHIAEITEGQMPNRTFTVIGKVVGLSRERIRQLSKKMNYVPHHQITKIPKQIFKICEFCQKEFTANREITRYCSGECRSLARFYNNYILLVCSNCGMGFLRENRRHHELIQREGQNFFCSKKCQGIWLSTGYGWGKTNHKLRLEQVPLAKYRKIFPKAFTIREYMQIMGLSRSKSETNLKSFEKLRIISKTRPYVYRFRKVGLLKNVN